MESAEETPVGNAGTLVVASGPEATRSCCSSGASVVDIATLQSAKLGCVTEMNGISVLPEPAAQLALQTEPTHLQDTVVGNALQYARLRNSAV